MNTPITRAKFWPFALFAAAAVLCGCGSEPVWKSQNFAFALPDAPLATSSKTNILEMRRMTISPVFQGRSFTYRTAENSYEHDPYAGFFVTPERAIQQPILAWLRNSGAFGSVIEPGSGLKPTVMAEVSVNELYGDFRKTGHPAGVLEIHFILYEVTPDGPGRVLLDKIATHESAMAKATPTALSAAWDTDLRAIMGEINSDLKRLPLN